MEILLFAGHWERHWAGHAASHGAPSEPTATTLLWLPPFPGCVLDTFFCLGWFGPYRRLWPHNAIHFSEVH